MMKKVKRILKEIKSVIKNDPLKKCMAYKEEGCSYVDGFLCKYPNCKILDDFYLRKLIKEAKSEKKYYDYLAIEAEENIRRECNE